MQTGKNCIRLLNNKFTFMDLIRCVQNRLIFELSINSKSREAHPVANWRERASIFSLFFCNPVTHFVCKWERGYHLRLVITVPIIACHNWSYIYTFTYTATYSLYNAYYCKDSYLSTRANCFQSDERVTSGRAKFAIVSGEVLRVSYERFLPQRYDRQRVGRQRSALPHWHLGLRRNLDSPGIS